MPAPSLGDFVFDVVAHEELFHVTLVLLPEPSFDRNHSRCYTVTVSPQCLTRNSSQISRDFVKHPEYVLPSEQKQNHKITAAIRNKMCDGGNEARIRKATLDLVSAYPQSRCLGEGAGPAHDAATTFSRYGWLCHPFSSYRLHHHHTSHLQHQLYSIPHGFQLMSHNTYSSSF